MKIFRSQSVGIDGSVWCDNVFGLRDIEVYYVLDIDGSVMVVGVAVKDGEYFIYDGESWGEVYEKIDTGLIDIDFVDMKVCEVVVYDNVKMNREKYVANGELVDIPVMLLVFNFGRAESNINVFTESELLDGIDKSVGWLSLVRRYDS